MHKQKPIHRKNLGFRILCRKIIIPNKAPRGANVA